MRDYKFRSWDGRMMHYNTTPYAKVTGGILCIGSCGYNSDVYEVTTNIDCVAIDVMQFTGLKDKNGKEIYEGDIWESCENGVKNIGVVEYHGCTFKVKYNHTSELLGFAIPYGNVIGNIYESPELLEVQK